MHVADHDSPSDLLLRRVIRTALSEGSREYEAVAHRVTRVRHLVHEELAAALSGPFASKLRQMDRRDLESRRELAAWANDQTRTWGLAIRCPATGAPSILIADARDEEGSPGRLRLQHRDHDGRVIRTCGSTSLPKFVLMEDLPRKEGRARPTGGFEPTRSR